MKKLFPIILFLPFCIYPGDLSFEEAVSLASSRADALKLDRLAIRRSSYTLSEARTLIFPELTFKAGAGYLTNPPEGITVTEGELGTIQFPPPAPSVSIPEEDIVFVEDAENTYFELSATLRQPIFTWLKIKNAIDIASLDLEISRMKLKTTWKQVRKELHRVYFGAVLSRESVTLIEEIRQIMKEILEDRQKALEVGALNLQAVLEADAHLAGVRKKLIEAQEKYFSALEGISFFTDLDPSALDLSSYFRTQFPEINEEGLKAQTVKNSSDLKQLSLELKQAQKNLSREKGGSIFHPDLSLNLTFELNGQTIPWSEDDWDENWNMNFIISIGSKGSLFDSGKSLWRIRQAEETVNLLRTGISRLKKQLHWQTRQAIEEVRMRYSNLQAKEAEFKEVEERLKNARTSYENELITREEWGGARLYLLENRMEHLSALYYYELSLAQLEFLTGGDAFGAGDF